MMEDYKLCECCGEEITQGRSDKRFCDKRCYNYSKNIEYRNVYGPIKNNIEAYKSSYRALSRLVFMQYVVYIFKALFKHLFMILYKIPKYNSFSPHTTPKTSYFNGFNQGLDICDRIDG
ncbi:hypothetical protein N8Z79_06510 [Crocinitomicaceae bacterium]|nr:hypothetical protein [Crocinitomicaceae bacterium]